MAASPVSRTPRLTVIIPYYQALSDLEATLSMLTAQTLSPDEFDVCVVNNEPAVPLDVEPHGLRLTVLTEQQPGSYAARATGVASSTTELLAFIDAGCLPRSDWLERGIAQLDADPSIDIVAGNVEVVWAGVGKPSIAARYELTRAFPIEEYVNRFGFGVTANIFSRRVVFDRVGTFDRSLMSGGDAEWCQRVNSAGGTIRYAGDVIVDHPSRISLRSLVKKARRVSGGLHHRMVSEGQTGVFLRRGIFHALLPPVRPVAAIVRTRRSTPLIAVKLVAIEVALNYVHLVERVKLLLGIGHPTRS